MVHFHVSKCKALVDEFITVKLCGSGQHADNDKLRRVTVYSFVDDKGVRYSAIGNYTRNERTGESGSADVIDLSRDASIGGSYRGVEPMGFIWAMRPESIQRKGCRILVRDARDVITVNLEAYVGHLNLKQIKALTQQQQKSKETSGPLICSTSLQRTYLADDVIRVPVRHGRVRGTLFYPQAYKTCPAVVDIFGMGGGIMEFRSAILASKGYVTLALPFFGYEDLPKKAVERHDLSYFLEAIDFMLNYPHVHGSQVGLIGVSKGAEIALILASLCGEKIRSVIEINSMAYVNYHAVEWQGERLPSYGFDLSSYVESPSDGCSSKASLTREEVFEVLPVERFHGDFLFVSCLDDPSVPLNSVDLLAERMTRAGRVDNFRVLRYCGAGHLIEVPYAPLCSSAYVKVFDMLMNYGGLPKSHHKAQCQFWRAVQSFFRRTLGSPVERPKL